jgi:hypothetical protein
MSGSFFRCIAKKSVDEEALRARSSVFSHSFIFKSLQESLLQSIDWLHSGYNRQPERPAASVRMGDSFFRCIASERVDEEGGEALRVRSSVVLTRIRFQTLAGISTSIN